MAVIRKLGVWFTLLWDRRLIAFAHDSFMAAISLAFALYLRVGDDILRYPPSIIIKHILVYMLLCIAVYLWTRPYQMVWRYVSIHDLARLAKTATIALILYWPLSLLLSHPVALPRSVALINWLMTIALLGAPRFFYRLLLNRPSQHGGKQQKQAEIRKILILGINDTTDRFLREIQYRSGSSYTVLGLIDQTKSRIGRRIHSIEVLGSIAELSQVLDSLQIKDKFPDILVITPDTLDGSAVQEIVALAGKAKVTLARLPEHTSLSLADEGKVELKPVSVEDLLGRPQNSLDREGMERLVRGKRVLVTGAGGTIGGELTRQICSFNPAQIILLDHSEYLLYTIDLELKENFPEIERLLVLSDVADKICIDQTLAETKPELVFHAAALKHVPIAEENPSQTVITNVVGTQNLADSCRKHQVSAMVLISTDKAINPTNVMGATKRLAEHYCQALDLQDSKKALRTHFITVRFGNVLGSTGSVVPLFQRQLQQGGPLTVTDPEMCRYFMTVHEAVELVLQAAVLGTDDNSSGKGGIFVLDMGQPIKIDDLARHMIRLAGLQPDVDIKIIYTGRRPGEKLYEELFYDAEKLQSTTCKSIYHAAPAVTNLKRLSGAIDEIHKAAESHDNSGVLSLLQTLVPEYQPDNRSVEKQKKKRKRI